MPAVVSIRIPAMLDPLTDELTSWWESLVRMLPHVVVALVIMVAFFFLARGLAKLTSKALVAWSTHSALHQLIVTSVRVGVILVGMFIALGVLELDKTVTSLLAGVGVVGLALGFAFQDIAANFMAGVIMGFRQPLHIGDLVEVKGVTGTVRELNLRATIIETFQGQLALVPNKEVLQNVLTNYTDFGHRRIDLEVGVAYDSDLEAVERVTKEALESLHDRASDKPVQVFFTHFGDSAINLVAHVWISLKGQQSFLLTRSEAVKAIKRAYDGAGIVIPFPIRTLDFGADAVGGQRFPGNP
ncbi:MAG: mechanosensitive ion channel [Enhygromyxa sp.]